MPDTPAPAHRIIVHRWDVRAPLPGPVVDEIRRARRLRNDLVQVEREHADAVAAVWSHHPDVAASEAAVAAAEEAVGAALDAVAVAKKRSGTPKAPRDETAALKAARVARREATAARRAAKEAAYPAVKAAMVEARLARRARVKALYRVHVDAGLFWASFNAVRDHHETAVRAVAARRKAGQAAEMRFRRWTGEGTIAVQLQRQAGAPKRSPAMLADPTSPWRNVAALADYPDRAAREAMTVADWRRHARRGVTKLTIRLGSGDHATHVTLPVAVGRPLPADADIVGLQLTRRLVAGKERASVAVTMRVPHVEPADGPPVGIHLGWRSMPDDTIRVAVVEGPAAPPSELVDAGVVRWWSTWGEVRVPASWVDEDRRLAAVAAQRDQNHNVAKAKLIDWLAVEPEPPAIVWPGREEAEPLTVQAVRSWRSPRRLASLTGLVCAGQGGLPASLVSDLEAWRRQDAHLWQWHAHGTDQLAARRLDAWRKVARWVCSDAGIVGVDEWSVPELVSRPDITEDRDWQADAARRNARLAAPGLLRAQVARAAASRGAAVVPVALEAAAHRGCGGILDREQARRSARVECRECGAMVDQDRNAVLGVRDAVRVVG